MTDNPSPGTTLAESGAPTTPETSTPSPAESAAGTEFAGLGTPDFDDLDVEIELPSESEAGGEKPPAEAEAGKAKPPEPATAAKPEPAKPEPPKPPAEAKPPAEGPKEPAAPAAASPPSGPRGLVEQITQHKNDILSELATTRFAWDAGEKKQFEADLDADATKALTDWVPRLMSRMYYESAVMALQHINQFVPQLMQNFTTLQKQHDDAEKAFFDQFKGLNKKDHWNDIAQFAQMFGKQNPQISQADLIALVGAAVMAKHKINPMAQPNGSGNGAAPSRKPSAPPFVPAQAGGGSPVVVKTEPENEYAGLGGHYDES
jgi:hypothetical protein